MDEPLNQGSERFEQDLSHWLVRVRGV
ncbi:hypothetical protein MNBD_ALPHA03-2018, partial [hydrothermal vent metagenome]